MSDQPNETLTPEEEQRKADLRARMLRGQEKMREMRAAGWKPVHKNPIEQALDKPNSLKAAIKAKCWECVGGDHDPGAKFRVRDCAVGARCPLYPHRPWQTVKGGVQTDADGVTVANDDSEDTNDD